PSLAGLFINSAKAFFGAMATPQQALQSQLAQMQQQFVNLLGAGSDIQGLVMKGGGGMPSMATAYNLADMAQLQLGNAFGKNGKLTPAAKTMIANLQAGYAPMLMNTGQFGSAVAAQTAMSGLAHTQLSAVNSAFDQLVQTVTDGPAGAAALFQML